MLTLKSTTDTINMITALYPDLLANVTLLADDSITNPDIIEVLDDSGNPILTFSTRNITQARALLGV